MTHLAGIPLPAITRLRTNSEAAYAATRPRSRALAGRAQPHFMNGVPLHWMTDWPTPFPLHVAHAEGATLTDVDGLTLDDFCLGDTGSMFGHSPPPIAQALARQALRGLTAMLPTADAPVIGEKLAALFGLPVWQIAQTATDANRNAIRVARAVTGRAKILVVDGAYHGTVEDTFVRIGTDGRQRHRPGLTGEPRDLTATATAFPFDDLETLERLLKSRAYAALIAEPVMTNCAMVLPRADWHREARRLTRDTGTLLIIDETHTLSTGLGGYTRVHGLDPDFFVCGKAIAGGFPTAVWGMRVAIAEAYLAHREKAEPGHSGMGTTLSANPMALAALAASLNSVMTPGAYAHMERGAAWLADGLSGVIEAKGLPWHVVRVGARIEFICAPDPLHNGREADAAHVPPLERALHLALLVRGSLIAPFHNMMLVSPVTTDAQIDRLVGAFDEVVEKLTV